MKNKLIIFALLSIALLTNKASAYGKDILTISFGYTNGLFVPENTSGSDAMSVYRRLDVPEVKNGFSGKMKTLKVEGAELNCLSNFHHYCSLTTLMSNLSKGQNNEVILKGDLAKELYQHLKVMQQNNGAKEAGNISCQQYSTTTYQCTFEDVVVY